MLAQLLLLALGALYRATRRFFEHAKEGVRSLTATDAESDPAKLDGYRDAKWGMSTAQVKKAFPGVEWMGIPELDKAFPNVNWKIASEVRGGLPLCFRDKIVGEPAIIEFYFVKEGGLENVILRFYPKNGHWAHGLRLALRKLLVGKYGEPHRTAKDVVGSHPMSLYWKFKKNTYSNRRRGKH